VQMPEMDGLEATAAIRVREREQGGHVPIVAMTAHAMTGDRERCLAAGMDAYLPKPLQPQEMMRVIEGLAPSGPGSDKSEAASPSQDELGTGRPARPAFDEQGALGRMDNDRTLLCEVIALFFEEAPRLLSVIGEGLEAADSQDVERAAHSLKGAAGSFGAADVVGAARELEAQGKSGDLTQAADTWARLRAGTAQLMDELRAFIAR